MSQKIEIDGVETELFTADELAAKAAEIEGIYKPQVEKLTGDLTAAQKASQERAAEFGQARTKFEELSKEQLSKLSEAELVIYNNTRILAEKDAQIAESNKKVHDSAVDAALKAKVGNDPKLLEKAKAMYSVIGLEDLTPEQISSRAAAAVGALMQSEPDLLASISVSLGGTYAPPVVVKTDESFANTEAGKAGAADLGLILEVPKTK